MSTSRNSRFQSSVAGAATGRRPSYGTSLGSSGYGTAGASSYGGTAGYSGYGSSYGGGGSASAYGRSGSYVPSSAAVANALSTSSAVLNSAAASEAAVKPAATTYASSTTSGYASTAGYGGAGGLTTTLTTANNHDSYGGAGSGVRSPLRRRFYSGANTDSSLTDLLRAAGCADPEAVTAGAPKYAGSAAGSPAVAASPARVPRSYRGARSNQELTLTEGGAGPSWMTRNGTSITNLDTAGTTTEIPTWRSKSLSSPGHTAAKEPVTTASSVVNSYHHDYDNHSVTATRPYSSRSSSRLQHADSAPSYRESASRLDSHAAVTEPEPSYYSKPPAMDRVSSISREMDRTSSTRGGEGSNYRVSTPRNADRGTPHRERRPPPVETMYGDEHPSPAAAMSPLHRSRVPPSVSREDLVKEYELIYTPKDRPTSEKLANGGETCDIPPPPMPSRSRRSVQLTIAEGFNICSLLCGNLSPKFCNMCPEWCP